MGYDEDDFLMLSGIQHFYYCKKQWALIHITQAWEESYDTMLGNIVHDKADNPYLKEKRKGVFYSRAMAISSKVLGLSGTADVVEFYKDEDGVKLNGKNGKWKIHAVEYKKGKSKKDHVDYVQLTAQVICLEEMFDLNIDVSYMYYHTTRNREEVKIDNSLREEVHSLCEQMHELYDKKEIPRSEYGKKCGRCSLKEICMPNLKNKKSDIDEYILKAGFEK